jgi:hypothetical protein
MEPTSRKIIERLNMADYTAERKTRLAAQQQEVKIFQQKQAKTPEDAIRVSEPFKDIKKPVTLLLKGEPGTGKTYKSVCFPSPALFSFDMNLVGLRKHSKEILDDLQVVNPRTDLVGARVAPTLVWDTFVLKLERVLRDPSIKTIIIDSLTTMGDCLMNKVIGTNSPTKSITQQDWGDFGRYLSWLGENLMCAPDLDKHVVMIAHEQLDKNELTQEVKHYLNIGGRMKTSYDLYFTDCWRCLVKQTGSGVAYYVRTCTSATANAKCSFNLPVEFDWDKTKGEVLKQLEL